MHFPSNCSIGSHLLFLLLLVLSLLCLLLSDVKIEHKALNIFSRIHSIWTFSKKSRVDGIICLTSGLILSFPGIALCPAPLTLQVSLLFLGQWLDLVGVEETLLAALSPVVVAGVVVEDLLVEEVSGLSQDEDAAICSASVSARRTSASSAITYHRCGH